MTVTITDEEAPLLPKQKQQLKKTPTPIPWAQFSIVLILQLAEPLTSNVIHPFAPQFVRDSGVTGGDEASVGYYVGLMQSIFFATQALTVLHWSRLSDHLGRKPIIMTGLCGLSMSMFLFGLSTTYWGAVLSRSLNGALNGNIGVLKSIVAEIMDSSNLPQAYAYMPISWSTGQAVGPAIGGYFSRPAEQFPDIFGNSEFLRKYPYFLACAIPAAFAALACLITFVFLPETVSSSFSIRGLFKMYTSTEQSTVDKVPVQETPTGALSLGVNVKPKASKPMPLKDLLTRRVVIAALNYAMLALVDIALRSLHPVFLSTPIKLGGLGLPPYMIGRVLSFYGVVNGLIQIFCFARIHNRYGTKRVYVCGLASALLVLAFFPVINAIARVEGYSITVWLAVALQLLISIFINFSYGCIFIYITAASPNKSSLGTVNGFCQVGVSIMRTIGPATANSLFSLSIDKTHHYLGGNMVYAVLACLNVLSLFVADGLPSKPWSDDEDYS